MALGAATVQALVLPIGRKFGRITQKRPSKKVSSLAEKIRADFKASVFSLAEPKRCRIFKQLSCFYLFLRITFKKWTFSSEIVEKSGPVLIKHENFFSAADFFPCLAELSRKGWQHCK